MCIKNYQNIFFKQKTDRLKQDNLLINQTKSDYHFQDDQ